MNKKRAGLDCLIQQNDDTLIHRSDEPQPFYADTFYFVSTGIRHIISIFNICMQTETELFFSHHRGQSSGVGVDSFFPFCPTPTQLGTTQTSAGYVQRKLNIDYVSPSPPHFPPCSTTSSSRLRNRRRANDLAQAPCQCRL